MKSRLLGILVLSISFSSLPACGEEKPATVPQSPKKETPKAPLIEKTAIADWCPEHGVPESICSRCNTSLVPDFKAKGDWCAKHDLPDSQCFVCHPDLEAKFKAMKPK